MRQQDSQVKRFTGGQMKLEKLLNELGFQTVLELEIENYRVDIFVPELNCIFEYDGKGYHSKRKDKERDEVLLGMGYITIRVAGDNLNPEYLKQQIAEKIDGATGEKTNGIQ
jgi:very-short-patch-repair endonuclease